VHKNKNVTELTAHKITHKYYKTKNVTELRLRGLQNKKPSCLCGPTVLPALLI